jgi:hypothetical protein
VNPLCPGDAAISPMQQHLFTILAVLVILFAILVALFNPMLSLYIIGGVVVFAIGLLIYRLARRG